MNSYFKLSLQNSRLPFSLYVLFVNLLNNKLRLPVNDVEHFLEDLVDDDKVVVLQLRIHHLRHQERQHLGRDQVDGQAESSVCQHHAVDFCKAQWVEFTLIHIHSPAKKGCVDPNQLA